MRNHHIRRAHPHAMRLDLSGHKIASRFGGGSHDATLHKPISLRRPNSYYRKLLVVLDELRASGKAWQTGAQITAFFNSKYSENRALDSVTKILSRFYVWGFVDYTEKPNDKRGGFWALKGEIEINDIDGLLLLACSHEQLNDKKTK